MDLAGQGARFSDCNLLSKPCLGWHLSSYRVCPITPRSGETAENKTIFCEENCRSCVGR